MNFKVIIIGESYVGKTAIGAAYFDLLNINYKSTIGSDFRVERIVKKQTELIFSIWDTAGQERFRSLTSIYYTKSDGVILVYDITKKETFDKIVTWLIDVQKTNCFFSLLLIGNKSDLEKKREVSYEEGKQLASQYGMMFYEASVYKPETIKKAFQDLFDEIIAVSYNNNK